MYNKARLRENSFAELIEFFESTIFIDFHRRALIRQSSDSERCKPRTYTLLQHTRFLPRDRRAISSGCCSLYSPLRFLCALIVRLKFNRLMHQCVPHELMRLQAVLAFFDAVWTRSSDAMQLYKFGMHTLSCTNILLK